MTKCLTVEVGPTEVQGETRIRRSALSAKRLMSSPDDDVKTLYDVVNYSVKVRPNLNAIGYRKVVKIIEEEKEITKIVGGEEVKEKKTWKFFQMSGYHWLTYKDAKQVIDSIGCGLRKFGVNPKDKMTVFGATRYAYKIQARHESKITEDDEMRSFLFLVLFLFICFWWIVCLFIFCFPGELSSQECTSRTFLCVLFYATTLEYN